MKKFYYIIIALLFSNTFTSIAQISEGGIPPSLNKKNSLRSAMLVPEYNAPIDFDVDQLLWQDEIVEENGGIPRFAVTIPTNKLGIDKSGQWFTLDDSTKVWKQSIKAEGAKGLLISYNDFYIPEGGKLFLYNADGSQIIGAYTHKTNPKGGLFSTEILAGDELTFEYVASNISDEKPRIDIEDIGYVYNTTSSTILKVSPGLNASGSCMIDINCPDGDQWQIEKRGVVMMMIKLYGGWNFCSGSLVNNTAFDRKPYILSANHCFRSDALTEQSRFYFNYEFKDCNQSTDTIGTYSLVGAKSIVQNPLGGGSDGALLLLNNNIPESWNPYFNGWDIRNIAPNSGVAIHHPNGDVKKIVTYKKPLLTATYSDPSKTGAANAHWQVVYDGRSVSEVGSSGSPIFSEHHLIVGTLTGGSSLCTNLLGPDYYAKLWYNWDRYNPNDGQEHLMSKYLDPLNSGTKILSGYGIIDGKAYKTDLSNISDIPTGIEDENKWKDQLKDFVLFPNPVQDQLNINSNSIIKKLTIYDLAGRIVYKTDNYNSSTISIPLNDFIKGVYSVTVETDDNRSYKDKFIKN